MPNDEEGRVSINLRVSSEQARLIDLAVSLGMAFSRSEYIRKAIDKLNEEIPKYQAIMEREKAKKELGEALDRRISERKM